MRISRSGSMRSAVNSCRGFRNRATVAACRTTRASIRGMTLSTSRSMRNALVSTAVSARPDCDTLSVVITHDSPRIPRFGSSASRGVTVVDQATATSFCAPPRPPAGARAPGAGSSGAEPAPPPMPRPAPIPTSAPISSPGPVANSGTMLATFLTLGVVGGMFLWVTSGSEMARANPEWWVKHLKNDVHAALQDYRGTGTLTTWKDGKSGGIVVSGVFASERLVRRLETIADQYRMLLDLTPTGEDREFGLTTIVFTPASKYRFNPAGKHRSSEFQVEIANRMSRGRAVGTDYVVTRRPVGNSAIIARFERREDAVTWIDAQPPPRTPGT